MKIHVSDENLNVNENIILTSKQCLVELYDYYADLTYVS